MSSPAPRKFQLTRPHPLLPTPTSSIWAWRTQTGFLDLLPSAYIFPFNFWQSGQLPEGRPGSFPLTESTLVARPSACVCVLETLNVWPPEPIWDLACISWNDKFVTSSLFCLPGCSPYVSALQPEETGSRACLCFTTHQLEVTVKAGDIPLASP